MVTQLATKYDIFFIQEFQAVKPTIEAVEDYAHRAGLQFYTGTGTAHKPNKTGIFVNPSRVTILGSQELEVEAHHAPFSTNVRVKTRAGDEILFQNFYLPADDKGLQADIVRDIVFSFDTLKGTHPSLLLFFGGDMNNSFENTPRKEKNSIMAIHELNHNAKTEDVAKYDQSISIHPTNKGVSSRRIDRLYAPRSWRKKAIKYQILKPDLISSTHHLIAVRFVMEPLKVVFVAKPRVQYPARRFSPPFNEARTRPIDQGFSMAEALHSIFSDGKEYIMLMACIRKHSPAFAELLMQEPANVRGRQFANVTMKTFFQTKKPEKQVFVQIEDAEQGTSADTTPHMIHIATDYYKRLYLAPAGLSDGELDTFLRPVATRLTPTQVRELDRPFTAEELLQALEKSNTSTAPGPDGIQFAVLRGYWEEIGPILTRTANEIMSTGKLPPCFRRVYITLIPKNQHKGSHDITDLRPILLSSTSLKVISKAVCYRLQKYLDLLIGPHQRGFIKNRRISQNIMEFFTMNDLIKQLREVSECSEYQAILMADFTKAFDRISHTYMAAVLLKMGFGDLIIRLLMLIMQDQEAQIFMNNCPGLPFAMKCGTRQGNPLSPLIFNLALEPFLLQLKRLKGIPITYQQVTLERMQYHAFADDVNIYLDDISDYKLAAKAIADYERVSNSKISTAKSKLLGFDPNFAQNAQNFLPFSQSHIGSEEVKYLGILIDGVDWTKFISQLPFRTVLQGYSHLDLVTRAKGTVIFVSSQVVYKDLVQCMSLKEVRSLDDGVKKVFQGIGKDKLYARPKNGGYGVMEMKVQLQGHRAKVLLHSFSSIQDWYTNLLRLKMLHHMAKILLNNERAAITSIAGLDWASFLFEQSGKFTRHMEWTFSPTERAYVVAWRQIVTCTRTFVQPLVWGSLPLNQIRDYITMMMELDRAPEDSGLTSEEILTLQATGFKSLSRKKQEEMPPIRPTKFTAVCPEAAPQKRWRKFWKGLYKHEWLAHSDFSAIHLFNFGSFVPLQFDQYHQATHFACHLCLGPVHLESFLAHLYNNCPTSAYWWRKVGMLQPMLLNFMLAPQDTSFANLRRLNWFGKVVRKVYSARHREAGDGNILEPLLNRLLVGALNRTDPMGR